LGPYVTSATHDGRWAPASWDYLFAHPLATWKIRVEKYALKKDEHMTGMGPFHKCLE